MANTTFNGPVRSENGFKSITKNSTTGAVTEIATLGAAPVALADGNVSSFLTTCWCQLQSTVPAIEIRI